MKKEASSLMILGVTFLFASGLTAGPAFADQHDMEHMGHSAQKGREPATYQGVGKVVSFDRAALTVKLAHHAITSLGWPGMTMDFRVANAAVLNGIKAGDAVVFDLAQGNRPGEWLVTRIAAQGG